MEPIQIRGLPKRFSFCRSPSTGAPALFRRKESTEKTPLPANVSLMLKRRTAGRTARTKYNTKRSDHCLYYSNIPARNATSDPFRFPEGTMHHMPFLPHRYAGQRVFDPICKSAETVLLTTGIPSAGDNPLPHRIFSKQLHFFHLLYESENHFFWA